MEKTPKVLFIIVAGIPADVLEETPTPHLDSIGHYTRTYVGGEVGEKTESPTISAVSYSSFLTGTWANKHNVWDDEIKDPDYDYWDIFRIAKNHNPALSTALFSTWTVNRTKIIGDGLSQAGGKKLDYFFDGFDLDEERFPHDDGYFYIRDLDNHVTDEAVRYVTEVGPDLSWLYLEFPDEMGHQHGDSKEFVDSVKLTDQQVGQVWDVIKKREATMNEDWLLIVTTDHGRDFDTGKDHGGQSTRERTTWIVTNSEKLNGNFNEGTAIVDIMPSIAEHLKLEIPVSIRDNLDGKSFITQ